MGLLGTLAGQLIPQQIIDIFGQEDALYNEFAVKALRIMTILIFILGLQQTIISYFQAVGKPLYSTIVSFLRQIGFMIPLLFLLPLAMGVEGIMFSFVLAYLGAVILCTILFIKENKILNQMIAAQKVREQGTSDA